MTDLNQQISRTGIRNPVMQSISYPSSYSLRKSSPLFSDITSIVVSLKSSFMNEVQNAPMNEVQNAPNPELGSTLIS